MNENLYRDIAQRTNSNIYIGVVGPVRTGKSTFIKRFMETLVIPRIENIYLKERAKDELPQSGSGRTIMTAEPKFVPEDAVPIVLDGDVELSVRLIDCVGYMIDSAVGRFENGEERMVSTPWYDHEISMTEAAEIGTHKVIADHSSIGLVVTTDGSVCGIPRSEYEAAEKRVIEELRAIGKPFIVLVNSTDPNGETALAVCEELQQKYDVRAMCVNCYELRMEDVAEILKSVLMEFPVEEITVTIPGWVEALPYGTPLLMSLLESIRSSFAEVAKIKNVYEQLSEFDENVNVERTVINRMDMGSGAVHTEIHIPRSLYYETLADQTGFTVGDDGELLLLLRELNTVKREYDRVRDALQEVRERGYGIVLPTGNDLQLEEPEIVQQGGKYAVKLKANAPAIHMIMTNVETTVSPAIGGESASGEIVNLLMQSLGGDAGKIWDSNIFGKSLYDIAAEGVSSKIAGMSMSARSKFQETLQRVINEGAGGLICIIL